MKHYGLDIPEGDDINNLTLPSGTTFPAAGNVAEVFYRTDQQVTYTHNGTGWISNISSLGGTITGSLTLNDHLYMDNANASIFMDSATAPDGAGFKRITCNDGGGNWNFRLGNYFSGGSKYTNANTGAVAIILSGESVDGTCWIQAAPQSSAAGDPITWSNTFAVSSSAVTINGNTVWHAGNDGPGSGLNADLIDNLNASQFMRSDVTTYCDGSIVTNGGSFYADASSNTTNAHIWFRDETNQVKGLLYWNRVGDTMRLRKYDAATGTTVEGELEIYGTFMRYNGFVVFHSGNDGTGSGLSADYAVTAAVPATTTSPGQVGQMAQDGTYLYVCTATDTWRRTPLSTW